MRRFIVAMILLFSPMLFSSPREYFLFLGDCTLPFDPLKDQEKISSSYFACQKGSAFVDAIYMPSKTFGVAGRIELKGSAHYGTTHAVFYDYYHEQIGGSNSNNIAPGTNDILDTAVYQFGNPSNDNLRILIGQQKPAFGINHFPDVLSLNQIFDPRAIWGFPQTGVNLVYDSQKATQIELGWLPSDSASLFEARPGNYLFTTRMMYDFSLNGNTRSILSIMVKKSGEKRLGFGLVSVGPNRNSFQAEWVRVYPLLPNSISGVLADTANGTGLNSSTYMQLIRLSYEDPPQRSLRTSILFDDLSFQYRLYALGVSMNLPLKWSVVRLLIAFKQDTSNKQRHRWIFGTGVGFQL